MMPHMKLIMENWNNFVKSEQLITEQQKNKACLMLESLYEEGVITEGIKDKLKSFLKKGTPKAVALALALTSFLGATQQAQATIAVSPDVVQSAGIDDDMLQSIEDQVTQNPDSMPHFEMQGDQLVFSDEGARGIVSFLLNYIRNPDTGGMEAVRELGGSGPFFQELNNFLEKSNSVEVDQLSFEDSELLTKAAAVLLELYARALANGETNGETNGEIDRLEARSLGAIFDGDNPDRLDRDLRRLMNPGTPYNTLFRQQANQPPQSGD